MKPKGICVPPPQTTSKDKKMRLGQSGEVD